MSKSSLHLLWRLCGEFELDDIGVDEKFAVSDDEIIEDFIEAEGLVLEWVSEDDGSLDGMMKVVGALVYFGWGGGLWRCDLVDLGDWVEVDGEVISVSKFRKK